MSPDDILGWLAPGNRIQLEELIARLEIRTVVEIGSFLGLSAAWFGQRVERVTCVDIWGLIPQWGMGADFYERFLANMEAVGVRDRIFPIRGDSHSAEIYDLVPEADLVYIDGDHRFEGCRLDIQMYGFKARKVLCGDDYAPDHAELAGVAQAVDEILPHRRLNGQFWWIEK